MDDPDTVHTVRSFNQLLRSVDRLMEEDTHVFAIAGVMMTIALSIYRSSLSEEDYHRIIESIVQSKDKILPWERQSIQ